MNTNNILKAASILFQNKLNGRGINSLPPNCTPQNNEEAYQIQNELKILCLSLKDNISIGKKVGCTNKIAQEQIKVYEPFYGELYSKFSSENNCTLKSNNFYKPHAEPEISFRMKEDVNITKAPFTIHNVDELFDGLLPSIEVVDFRFNKELKNIGIYNLISSNGASEHWIHGENIYPINKINLENHVVSIYVDSLLIDKGNTNKVLENPLNSAIWIINQLALKGEPLLKGQFISTGTCTKAIQIKPGNTIKADFGSIGSVKLNYV